MLSQHRISASKLRYLNTVPAISESKLNCNQENAETFQPNYRIIHNTPYTGTVPPPHTHPRNFN